VTGGCGFIGSTLVPLLLERSAQVRILDNLVAGGPEPPREAELTVGDVRNPIGAVIARHQPDAIIHLAAAGNVPDSIADPVANFEVNARGTLNVLRAAVDAKARPRFVYASSSSVYAPSTEPLRETAALGPLSPYGASKLAGEGYLHAFRGSYGLDAVALRFGNVYGPHSAHKKGAVTMFIKRSLRGEPLVIYGDGSASRDFIHVRDLCDGILADVERAVADAPAGHLVVVTLHHHPLPLPEETLPELLATRIGLPYASELRLGETLLMRLRGRCDLVLHGHRHVPRAHTLFAGDARPLGLYNAGCSPALGRFRVFAHAAGKLCGAPGWLLARERRTHPRRAAA